MAEQPDAKTTPDDPKGVPEGSTVAPAGEREKPPFDPIEHDRRVRRFLLRLSLANWGVAALAWTISAYLGSTSPASIIVYSVLFVIGLIAAIVAMGTYLLEKFGHEPQVPTPGEHDADGDEGAAEAAPGDDASAAAAG